MTKANYGQLVKEQSICVISIFTTILEKLLLNHIHYIIQIFYGRKEELIFNN